MRFRDPSSTALRSLGRLLTGALVAGAALAAAPLGAQQSGGSGGAAATPRIVDRSQGEEDQISQREEWFYSSRRDGTASAAERARLRLEGVEATRRMLAAQQQRQAASPAGGGQNFWVSKGPSPSSFGGWAFGNISGRVSAIAADWSGGVLWVGTASGGLWKSINDGVSYTSVFDTAGTLTIGAIAVDPGDADVVWVGTGENNQGCESYFGIGLLRSPDGGATWESRNGSGGTTLDQLGSFANIIVDPRDSNHIVTGGRVRGCASGSETSGAIYSSDDGGLSWAVRLNGREVHEIVQDPTVLDVFWAGTSSGVYKSIDNGVSWTLQTASGLPTNAGRTEIAIAPSNGNVVYALFSGGGRSLWRTTDGGASWDQRSTGSDACDGQCSYNMVLRVHPTTPTIVYRGTIRVYRSIAAGSGWTDLTLGWGSSQKVHQDIQSMLVHPTQPGTFYVGSDGGIWKTVNDGASFTNVVGNMNLTQFYAVEARAADPQTTICGGAQDNSSLVRTSGDVWALQQVTGDGFVCHFDPQDPNIAYITSYPWSGYPSLLRSTSGPFGPFQQVTGSGSGINGGDSVNWVTPHLLDPSSPNILYIGTQRVYRSTDYGSSWTPQGPANMAGGGSSMKALDINRAFPGNLLAGSTGGKVWHTDNSGTDWTDLSAGLPGFWVNDVAADPTNPDRGFAVLGGFNIAHVWEWNAGQGWTARGLDLPNVPANTVLMLSDSDILVGMDTGVFRSLDGGVTFEPYMDGLPQGLVVSDLKLDVPHSLVTAGTYGRGAWQTVIDPVAALIVFDSVVQPLVEEDGDGDSNVEPGETFRVRPILRNAGGQPAMGVSARLATTNPKVTVLEPSTVSFGDLQPGATASAAATVSFMVDPTLPCGEEIVFDIVDIVSTDPPASYGDVNGAFTVQVVDSFTSAATVELFDDGLDDEAAPARWTRQAVASGGQARPDAGWRAATDGDGRRLGYYVATGAQQAWLHHGGTDSSGGAGLEIPRDALAVRLSVVHRAGNGAPAASRRVVIDPVGDGRDEYETLEEQTSAAASDGWTTSTFDLSPYRGRRVHLAFVYDGDGDGDVAGADGGWAIDEVGVELQPLNDPVCQITRWPGSVPPDVQFRLSGPGTIEATWNKSCNIISYFGQKYAIHAGDLDVLRATGTYTHAAVDSQCNRTSPSSFTAGAGNEYYLVVPTGNGREGGQGRDSDNMERPQTDMTCGIRREDDCH